jgi:hypothetical protein
MIDRTARRLAGLFSVALAVAAFLGTVGAQAPAGNQDLTFEGSWSAVGRRRTLATEGDRAASVIELSGAVVLSGDTGLSRGFKGEAIGFDDGREVGTGRAVWTDSRGDQVFSVLRAGTLQTGGRVVGEFTGGTGRYAGIAGRYEMTWQYVANGEREDVQGRAADLRGSFRLSGAGR